MRVYVCVCVFFPQRLIEWNGGGKKKKEGENNENEGESQLNETRAIVRVHFSIIIFSPYFYETRIRF